MTLPVSGGVPEQGLREALERIANYEYYINDAAGVPVMMKKIARAALERPRPALPAPEPSPEAILAATRAVFARRDFPTVVHSGTQRGNVKVDLSEIKADVTHSLRAAYAIDGAALPAPEPQLNVVYGEVSPEAHEQLVEDFRQLSHRLERATQGQVSIDPNRLRGISNYLDEKGLTRHETIKRDAEWLLEIADALDGPSEEMKSLVRGAALPAPTYCEQCGGLCDYPLSKACRATKGGASLPPQTGNPAPDYVTLAQEFNQQPLTFSDGIQLSPAAAVVKFATWLRGNL